MVDCESCSNGPDNCKGCAYLFETYLLEVRENKKQEYTTLGTTGTLDLTDPLTLDHP
jgi:hypothetical protein